LTSHPYIRSDDIEKKKAARITKSKVGIPGRTLSGTNPRQMRPRIR
jgi:hypothetical protein